MRLQKKEAYKKNQQTNTIQRNITQTYIQRQTHTHQIDIEMCKYMHGKYNKVERKSKSK